MRNGSNRRTEGRCTSVRSGQLIWLEAQRAWTLRPVVAVLSRGSFNWGEPELSGLGDESKLGSGCKLY